MAQMVTRPIVRSFKQRFVKEAAAHAHAGGHSVIWEGPRRARLVFRIPPKANPADFGAWSVYDLGKYRWDIHQRGLLKGLASTLVPRDCLWVVRRRAERDSIHRGPTRKLSLDCTTCAACCTDNEVLLQEADIERLRKGGREELTKRPYAKRDEMGRLVLTLLPDKRCRHLKRDKRCGIYELRPESCSEFPAASESCLYAREDSFEIYDGVAPGK